VDFTVRLTGQLATPAARAAVGGARQLHISACASGYLPLYRAVGAKWLDGMTAERPRWTLQARTSRNDQRANAEIVQRRPRPTVPARCSCPSNRNR